MRNCKGIWENKNRKRMGQFFLSSE
ncbi:hypothetical protein Goshw_022664 [Gossypium schwendimanii]|uniref:Uncharacterized protein n=1 Tax=Gossypium schwendimanii TaxID=34291 RepID=A0A7J9L574_GOSSC|nr:hypothetical protein [Gossypium schwendimanii]